MLKPCKPGTEAAAAPATWVLLRGLTRSSRHWGPFLPRFTQAAAPALVLAPDLPGNGERWRERSPARVAQLLEGVRAQVLTQAPPPYRLLALSLGAMVALEWSQRHPHEVCRRVLINTSLAGLHPWHWRLRPANLPVLLRLALGLGTPEALEQAVWRLTTRLTPPDIVGAWVRCRRDQPVSRASAWAQLWAAARYRCPTAPVPCPTLLLAGGADALVNPDCSHDLARRFGWPLCVHPTAGHDLPLDAPDWTMQQIL